MGLLAISYGTFGHPPYGTFGHPPYGTFDHPSYRPLEHLAFSLRACCVSLFSE